jgi:CHAT domain-containing protein
MPSQPFRLARISHTFLVRCAWLSCFALISASTMAEEHLPSTELQQRLHQQLEKLQQAATASNAEAEMVLTLCDQMRLAGHASDAATGLEQLLAITTLPLRVRILGLGLQGQCLASAKNWPQAQQAFIQANQTIDQAPLTPAERGELQALTWLTQADAARSLHQYSEGLQLTEKVLTLPQDAHRFYWQAYSLQGTQLHELGQFARAIESFEKAIANLPPSTPHAEDQRFALESQICLSLLRNGRAQEALQRGQSLQGGSNSQRGRLAITLAMAQVELHELNAPALAESSHLQQALLLGDQGLKALTESLDPESPQLVPSYLTHARHLHLAGEMDQAEQLLQRALSISGPGTANHRDALENLWPLLLDQGRPEQARAAAARLAQDWSQWITQLSAQNSETERLTFSRQNHLLEAVIGSLPPTPWDSVQSQRLAEAVLLTHSLVFDSMQEQAAGSATLKAYQAAIPGNAALILYTHYRSYRSHGVYREKLLAMVLTAKGVPQFFQLDAPAWITEQSRRFQQDISAESAPTLAQWIRRQFGSRESAQDQQAMQAMDQLRQQLWQPLLPALKDLEPLYLVLDNSMTTVPSLLFADEDSHTLPSRAVTFLASPQSLLRLQSTTGIAPAPPWLLANAAPSAPLELPGGAFPYDLVSGSSPALPGAQAEVLSLQRHSAWHLLTPASELQLRQQLAKLRPSVFHFTGHATAQADPHLRPHYGSSLWQGRQQPIAAWRSCLHFSQPKIAQDAEAMQEDDWLFAAEIAQLELSSTRLVTLSACSTAAGISPSTEGAYSLARAFHAAGVPNVLACTVPLRDQDTAEYMQQFYTAILAGQEPASAAWQTQIHQWRVLRHQVGFAKALGSIGFFRLTRSR